MSRDVFVSLDGGGEISMRLELHGHGHIPPGTVTRGRHLYPFGRPRLIDPKDWIDLEILGILEKIGNKPLYRATRRSPGELREEVRP